MIRNIDRALYQHDAGSCLVGTFVYVRNVATGGFFPMTSSGIEPATFRQLRHRVSPRYLYIQDDRKVSVHPTQCIRTIPTQLMGWRWPSQNTFGLWTVLYWTRSSRTQFGVPINVWRLAGDTLNVTCKFLYCNHRVIKSRRMRWAGHVARMGEERWVYRVLVGKPEGKRPLGRPRHRRVDGIRMDLQEVGCGFMDWIGLTKNRDRWRTLVSAVMNLGVPWNARNFLTSCKPVSFSRRILHHGVSK